MKRGEEKRNYETRESRERERDLGVGVGVRTDKDPRFPTCPPFSRATP